MSSLEEIGNILKENLLFCSYDGIFYVVHKDDFVTVKDSEGKDWGIFRKGYREKKRLSLLQGLINCVMSPGIYEPGITVWKSAKLPYNMEVLVRTKGGELEYKKLEYDEVLFDNAEEKGVRVNVWK